MQWPSWDSTLEVFLEPVAEHLLVCPPFAAHAIVGSWNFYHSTLVNEVLSLKNDDRWNGLSNEINATYNGNLFLLSCHSVPYLLLSTTGHYIGRAVVERHPTFVHNCRSVLCCPLSYVLVGCLRAGCTTAQ